MKERKGWTGSQSDRMLFLTMGSLLPLSWLSLGSWSRAAPAVPWERPCSNQTHGEIWVAFSNSLVFVPFLTFTPLFLLTELSLTSLSFHFLRKWIHALGTQFCHLPPDTLRSNRLSDSRGNAVWEMLRFVSCQCQSTPPIPPRGARVARGSHLAFVLLSLSVKMQTNLPSFSLLNSEWEGGDVGKVRELRKV